MAQRTTLVTGTTRGIGQAIANRLTADGHEVIGLARGVPDNPVGPQLPSLCRDPLADLDDLVDVGLGVDPTRDREADQLKRRPREHQLADLDAADAALEVQGVQDRDAGAGPTAAAGRARRRRCRRRAHRRDERPGRRPA